MQTNDVPPHEDQPAPADDSPRENPSESPDTDAPHLVPVQEARRYRKRAQTAEHELTTVRQELEAKDQTLQQQQQAIHDLQLAQRIDTLLIDAGTIDLETARLLAELHVAEQESEDPEAAVRDLQIRKPFLFRMRHAPGGAMSPRDPGNAPDTALAQAAANAHQTGRRQDLLQYLRLRRRR